MDPQRERRAKWGTSGEVPWDGVRGFEPGVLLVSFEGAPARRVYDTACDPEYRATLAAARPLPLIRIERFGVATDPCRRGHKHRLEELRLSTDARPPVVRDERGRTRAVFDERELFMPGWLPPRWELVTERGQSDARKALWARGYGPDAYQHYDARMWITQGPRQWLPTPGPDWAEMSVAQVGWRRAILLQSRISADRALVWDEPDGSSVAVESSTVDIVRVALSLWRLPPGPLSDRCAEHLTIGVDLDADGRADRAYHRWLESRLSSSTLRGPRLGACTAAGLQEEIDGAGQTNGRFAAIDVQPDGRPELLFGAHGMSAGGFSIAVITDGHLREVVTDDDEAFGVTDLTEPELGTRPSWWCADVDGDGVRELVELIDRSASGRGWSLEATRIAGARDNSFPAHRRRITAPNRSPAGILRSLD